MIFQQVGNRLHFYADADAATPFLHVHPATGGLISPAAEDVTTEQVAAVAALLETNGAQEIAARTRDWWAHHGSRGTTFRRRP